MRSRISFILKMEGEWKEIKSLRWDKALRVLRERERVGKDRAVREIVLLDIYRGYRGVQYIYLE